MPTPALPIPVDRMHPASFVQHCQGAIAGAWQAQCYGHWCLNHAPKHLWLTQWSPLPWQAQPPHPLAWAIGDRCAQDLISHGQVFPDRWLADLLQHHDFETASPARIAVPTPAEILLALLPVALFYHDDPIRLAQASQSLFLALRREWPASISVTGNRIQTESNGNPLAAAWVSFALALAQICQGNRELLTLIPQVLATFPVIAPRVVDDPQAMAQAEEFLQIAQRGLTQGVGLAAVVSTLLEPAPEMTIAPSVALALYCFLSAPWDFRWAVVRSLQATRLLAPIGQTAPMPGWVALTGALAGCYHGGYSLPLALPVLTEQPLITSHPLAAPSRPAVFEQMLPLAAAWAGAYDPRRHSTLPVVTLPRSVDSSP